MPRPEQPLGDHFNYDDLATCKCYLCDNLRRLDAVFREAQASCADLPYRSMKEPASRFRKAHRALLAHSNRRDVYSELSYLTHGRAWSREFLAWVWDRIHDPKWKTENWWANCSEHKTLGEWIADWHATRLIANKHNAARTASTISGV